MQQLHKDQQDILDQIRRKVNNADDVVDMDVGEDGKKGKYQAKANKFSPRPNCSALMATGNKTDIDATVTEHNIESGLYAGRRVEHAAHLAGLASLDSAAGGLDASDFMISGRSNSPGMRGRKT